MRESTFPCNPQEKNITQCHKDLDNHSEINQPEAGTVEAD